MTLKDLKNVLVNRLSSRIAQLKEKATLEQAGYVNGLPESEYERRLRLTPEQRYQDIKKQSFEHAENRYYKYHSIYNEFYKVPEDGDNFRAYSIASSKAEALFNEGYPEGGCETGKCIPSCRFYAAEGRIEDSELAELCRSIV
jgi:hypothetical protein